MARLLLSSLFLLFATAVAAQPKDEPQDRFIYKLTTTPAAAPVPALKHDFRVRQPEKLPGNAALDYYRAALLFPEWPRDPKEGEKLHAKLDGWETMPIAVLPVAEVTSYLDPFSAGSRHWTRRPGETSSTGGRGFRCRRTRSTRSCARARSSALSPG